MLKNGVRPLVEISFMPTRLAENPYDLHVFWYHPNVSPPRDWQEWDAFMQAFAQHLVDRYGLSEVSKWYFDVWNEPNIDFWGGIPRHASYFVLAHGARGRRSTFERSGGRIPTPAKTSPSAARSEAPSNHGRGARSNPNNQQRLITTSPFHNQPAIPPR
ncbi:MAG TPA: hypothetical protein VME18_09505 [Acidobacteriaceae bacterium]|nr:hypothetical protein [Acidobacteriaceae bacterium]